MLTNHLLNINLTKALIWKPLEPHLVNSVKESR